MNTYHRSRLFRDHCISHFELHPSDFFLPMHALDFIRSHTDTFSRVGSVVASYRTRGSRRFGPYYRVAYRVAGRQCSFYLGRGKQLAHRARSLLAQLQQPRDDLRRYKRAQRRRRVAFRRVIRHWQQTIRAYGLDLRGCAGPRLARPRHPPLR